MEMLVECILRRPGGSKVDMGGGVVYHFHPKNDPEQAGRDIAVVNNRAHFQRFMQIPEGYQIPEDRTETKLPAPTTFTAPPVNPQAIGVASSGPAPTGTVLPAATAPQGDGQAGQQAGPADVAPVILAAPAGATVETVPPAPAPAPVQPVTLDPPPPVATALPDEEALRAMDLDALRAQAALELGRKPSAKAKEDVLISQILTIREEKAAAAAAATA